MAYTMKDKVIEEIRKIRDAMDEETKTMTPAEIIANSKKRTENFIKEYNDLRAKKLKAEKIA